MFVFIERGTVQGPQGLKELLSRHLPTMSRLRLIDLKHYDPWTLRSFAHRNR